MTKHLADELDNLFTKLDKLKKYETYWQTYDMLQQIRSNKTLSDDKIKDILTAVVDVGECTPSDPQYLLKSQKISQLSEELKAEAEKSAFYGNVLLGLALALTALCIALLITFLVFTIISAPPFSVLIVPAVAIVSALLASVSSSISSACFTAPSKEKHKLANNLSSFFSLLNASSNIAKDDITITDNDIADDEIKIAPDYPTGYYQI